jgi:hypothetical protein
LNLASRKKRTAERAENAENLELFIIIDLCGLGELGGDNKCPSNVTIFANTCTW